MPTEGETTETGTGTNTGTTPPNGNQEPTTPTATEAKFTQADVNRMLAETKRQERERVKTEAENARLQEQGEYKTLLDKANAELEAARAEIQRLTLASVRDKIGRKYELPEDIAERLIGNDETEIEADAKKIKRALDARATASNQELPPGTPPGSNGNSGGNTADLDTRKKDVRRSLPTAF